MYLSLLLWLLYWHYSYHKIAPTPRSHGLSSDCLSDSEVSLKVTGNCNSHVLNLMRPNPQLVAVIYPGGCKQSGGWINIKMPSYQYRKSHCLHNGISYAGKMTSLYWIRALSASHILVAVCSRASVTNMFVRTIWHSLALGDFLSSVTQLNNSHEKMRKFISMHQNLPTYIAWCHRHIETSPA